MLSDNDNEAEKTRQPDQEVTEINARIPTVLIGLWLYSPFKGNKAHRDFSVPRLEVQNNSPNPIGAISQSTVVRKESLHETLLQKIRHEILCMFMYVCQGK